MVLSVIACMGFFTGCTQKPPRYDVNPLMANLSASQKQQLKVVVASGMQVIKRGMLFRFIIPTDTFFDRDTRFVKSDKEPALFALANFLRTYKNYFTKPRIFVAGFSDKVWLYPKRKKLSLHYAKQVAKFLVVANVPLKVKDIRGYGAKHPIASNEYPKGTAYNRRVEVLIE